MKIKAEMNKTPLRVLAIVLAALAAGPAVHTQSLQARIDTRPLTPSDIVDYGLPAGTEGASGLSNVPLGQPVYLEAQVTNTFPTSNIVGVTWAVTSKPVGSSAALSASPLGTQVPLYRPSDAFRVQVAGRTVLTPDIRGQYTVTATITTTTGSTNVAKDLTAGTYLGVRTCALCHSGGVGAPDKYHPWSETGHAGFFKESIDGVESPAYSKSCIECHTLGYDTNSLAVNGGFDDVATQLGWAFPAVLTNGNWAALPAELKNLANIQCEKCHGPGSEHAFSLGNTNRIARSFNPGVCGQCHDSKNNYVKVAEWKNSGHAVAPRLEGPTRWACMRCHNAQGFKNYTQGVAPVGLPYEPIECAACHDPHDATNPKQLRLGTDYTFPDGTTVTNAGLGGFCMNCHHSRNGSVTNSLVNYPLGLPTWEGGSAFGVHNNPQGDMLEGINAVDYGKAIPSAAHRFAVTNTCVGCHMQAVAPSSPAFTKAGGHSWNMRYDVVVTNGPTLTTNTVDLVDVCVKCHGPITSFNMVKVDYNNDGVTEGVQTEVQKLLNKLSTLLPPTNYVASGNYVADGRVKTRTQITVRTNWPAKFLKAAYNYQFVERDLSLGVHNAPYATGLLKASIADLTGDANMDGLPDWWQVQYFGSANASNAAPNATPAGDGIPNWLKYSLELNPMVAGMVVPDGVVWANAGAIGGGTNTLHIYTAAEVVFDTELGKTYLIQSVSSLGGGWQDVGGPIAGTGRAISYVTPTRSDAQQFFRVVVTP